MKFHITFIFTLLSCLTGMAASRAVTKGGGSTGGGNVVVCLNPATQQRSIQFLDYYEAETLMPELKPDLGGAGTELDRVLHVLKRLSRLDRGRADAYEKVAREFDKNNVTWLTSVNLPNINDHGYVPLKNYCSIEQIAIQRLVPFPEAKKYVIRKDFWNALTNPDERAGLILHEIIYEEALRLGHKSSVNSRYLNALFSSRKLETMSDSDYRDRMIQMGFDVTQPHSPPHWLQNPILATGKANNPFSFALGSLVTHPDGDALTFQMMSGPGWLALGSNGRLSGIPTLSNVGENTFQVVAADPFGHTATATVKLTIVDDGPSPSGDTLPDAHAGTPYSGNLKPYFKSLSSCQGAMQFSAADSLPPWLRLDGFGQIMGVPSMGDVGDFTFRVVAQCEDKGETKQFRLKVLPGASIGVHFPSLSVKERQVFSTNLNVPQFVTNPSGGPLTFTLLDPADWINLTAQGVLTVKPLFAHIGDHKFRVRVSDGTISGDGKLAITVVRDPQPPFWLQNPIDAPNAVVNQLYNQSIASFAVDPDAFPLTFHLVSGPAWLMVTSAGILSGTPGEGDFGASTFVVEVSNGILSVRTVVQLKVIK